MTYITPIGSLAAEPYLSAIDRHIYDLCDFVEVDPIAALHTRYALDIEVGLVPHSDNKTFYFFGDSNKIIANAPKLKEFFRHEIGVCNYYLCTHQPEDESIFFIEFDTPKNLADIETGLLHDFGYTAWCTEQDLDLLPF